MIKIYEVPNILLDDEPILKNVMGCDIHWKGGRRAGHIRTFNKRERTDSLFCFFR